METTREANTWGFGLSYDMHAKNESALAWQNKLFGPTANSTLLEFLEEHSVKATFFVCGFNYVYFNPQWRALVKEIHNRGHEIGCHTIGHVEWDPRTYTPWSYFSEQIYPNYQSRDLYCGSPVGAVSAVLAKWGDPCYVAIQVGFIIDSTMSGITTFPAIQHSFRGARIWKRQGKRTPGDSACHTTCTLKMSRL